MAKATPPANLRTPEEFLAWKPGEIEYKGHFKHRDQTYLVLVGPTGAHLNSGPSAYLFDEKGQFVDWTPDMGDAYTFKKSIWLGNGPSPLSDEWTYRLDALTPKR